MLLKPTILLPLIICFLCVDSGVSQENHDVHPLWENTTSYSKTYYVDQRHVNASDSNSGSRLLPFRTIGPAVKVVKAGERILIHRGIYREAIELERGGSATDNMILIESAKGHEVVVKGSVLLSNQWVRVVKPGRKVPKPTVTTSRSKRLWITQIDASIFSESFNPIEERNMHESNNILSRKGVDIENMAPFNLSRLLLFQNKKRMVQLSHYGDLTHVEGTFWIDADKRTIHIHPFGWVNPNEEEFEITVKGHLLKPNQKDVNYIHVKGLVFEHCANAFSSIGNGAVSTMGGHHWIFENNVIREINSIGLEFSSISQTNSSQKQEEGYINVINNKIYSCGTAGINSKKVPNAFIRENHIANCGWHEAEVYGECAGIKIYQSSNSVISHNRVHHIGGGAGIWLEWGNENTHVTRNIIHDIATQNGALIINTSRKINKVDNNFIWNVDGVGINGNNSENQLYYHNLIAYTSEAIVQITETGKIVLDSARLNVKNNRVSNNIFIDFQERMNLSTSTNIVSNNAFVFNSELGEIELKKWQEKLISKQGALMRADVSFNPNTMLFKWNAPKELLRVPTINDAIYDFANEKRNVGMTIPGPFRSLLPMTDYYVSLKAK